MNKELLHVLTLEDAYACKCWNRNDQNIQNLRDRFFFPISFKDQLFFPVLNLSLFDNMNIYLFSLIIARLDRF